MQKQVTVIPAKINRENERQQSGPLRVAAYCRVSTDDEEQLTSYKNQIEFYTQLIEGNPNWKLAGIFPDEGLSGTNTRKRPEFNRMMAACRRGRIDRIITKSVSRFARNTVDCLKYARMLKELGISIYFQKEGIDTATMSSEMLLTIFGSFAQAESESISANVAWGKRKAFREGKVIFQYKKLLGYRKGEDGEPEIIEEEAKIVRRIFRSYLSGQSMPQIEAALIEDNVPPPGKDAVWQRSHIKNILTNEKYMGDALLQKTFVVDCISKKTKKNNGELPQYYVTDNHPAIVSREMFHKVQEEIARRNSKLNPSGKPGKTNRGRFSCKYALTELIRCEECGAPYRRVTWTARGKRRVVWRCLSRLQSGKDICSSSITIPEADLHAAVMRGIQARIHNPQEVLGELSDTLKSILYGNGEMTADDYAAKIKLRQDTMMRMTMEAMKHELPEDYYDHKFMELAEEIAALEKQKANLTGDVQIQARLHAIEQSLVEDELDLSTYNDTLVYQEVESILVRRGGRILMKFKAGGESEGSL